jgi:hypothetical protein
MKAVEIQGSIREDRDLFRAVQRANELLDQELGALSGQVSAGWRLAHDDADHPLVTLDLSVEDEGVRHWDVIKADDLKNEWEAQGKLIRAWGGLLKERSRKLLRGLRSADKIAEGA